jgi:hypothetical protein
LCSKRTLLKNLKRIDPKSVFSELDLDIWLRYVKEKKFTIESMAID